MKHKYIAFTTGDPTQSVTTLKTVNRMQPPPAVIWRAWVLEFDPDDPDEPPRDLTDSKLRPVQLSADGRTMTTEDGLLWKRVDD